jgi:hypothetical protein
MRRQKPAGEQLKGNQPGPTLGFSPADIKPADLLLSTRNSIKKFDQSCRVCAIRWRSFTVAMGLGIGGTVIGIMLLRSLKNIASTPHGPLLASLFPWSLPYIVIARQATTSLRQTAFLVGIVGGVFIAALGCWEVIRRDVA